MNRLKEESSSYLRQHQNDPVDWFAWGDEAFEEAKHRDCPILLSIGFASCHWCHVMAHESFADSQTAEIINKSFVSIKVDREEHIDVDAAFMEAVFAMSGHGGWPMTIFLTPDGKPFVAATYVPREPTTGHPGFVAMLGAVADTWQNQRDDFVKQANELNQVMIERLSLPNDPLADSSVNLGSLLDTARAEAVRELLEAHDHEWGGFGAAPKFPRADALRLLLRDGSPTAIEAVKTTLDSMAAGGIFDQVGGGFCRYSTDAFWMVPHFEKQLVDQALLVDVYTRAFVATGQTRFLATARATADYVLRELSAPNRTFYSAQDADSAPTQGQEPEEGAFYTWRIEEIQEVLGDEELTAEVVAAYGLTQSGNFEGSNILHRPRREAIGLSDRLSSARAKLLSARGRRPQPPIDKKVLTDANAAMVTSLANLARVCEEPDYLKAAIRAANALMSDVAVDGRPAHVWYEDSGAKFAPTSLDLAQLAIAMLAIEHATGDVTYLTQATNCAELLINQYLDAERGTFYLALPDPHLPVRPKQLIDNGAMAANSLAAEALYAVGARSGDSRFIQAGDNACLGLHRAIGDHPTAFVGLLSIC